MEDALYIRCHLTEGIVRGTLIRDPGPLAEALAPVGGPSEFITLIDVTVTDPEGRMIAREKALAISKYRLLFLAEDPRAHRLNMVKNYIGIEDYDTAVSEVSELIDAGDVDAELYYLAGLAELGAGHGNEAQDWFQKALDDCLDPAFRHVIERHLE